MVSLPAPAALQRCHNRRYGKGDAEHNQNGIKVRFSAIAAIAAITTFAIAAIAVITVFQSIY